MRSNMPSAANYMDRKISPQNTVLKSIVKNYYLYLFFLPVLIYYIVFRYAPMAGALLISFKQYDIGTGILASKWVGLSHFEHFFNSVYFWRLLRNTLGINIFGIVFAFPTAILLALLLNEVNSKHFKKLVQSVSYMPNFISSVVIVSMVVTFLSPSLGFVNNLIAMFGGEKIHFLVQPKYFWGIYTVMVIWQTTGFNSIIYLAALTGINPELKEAAYMDGAGRWRQLWHITLPGISQTIIIMLLIRVGHMLDVGYEAIILLYNPNIYETADVINSYVYRMGLLNTQYSFASAVGLFQALIGFVLIVISNKLAKKFSETSIW